MNFRVRDIFATGEQYHARRAIETHGEAAVISMRAQHLHKANPSLGYPLCHAQAGYEVNYLGSIAAGEKPFKCVRTDLDRMAAQIQHAALVLVN